MLAAMSSAPFLGPGVDQDMALAAGDEDGGNAAGADQIGVGVDPDRRRGLVPIGRNLRKPRPIAGPTSSIGARGRSI